MNNISRGEALITKTIKDMYQEGQTDYFLDPIVLIDDERKSVGPIKDGDSVIFCCRRGEREIQLTRAFVDPSFNKFPLINFKNLNFANGNVIGHIDNLDAKIKCAEALDKYLGQVIEGAQSTGYITIITADHGVAPTILQIMGLPKPEFMNGKSLIQNYPDINKNSKKKVLLVVLDGWGIGKNDEINPIFY